jgi:poly(A) polymerase/tRNA nucleotidyltransferase (CCA-adding enzyme)
MDRPDEITLPAQTPWLRDPDAQAVCRAVASQGARIYFVGGCVRDALLGLGGLDTDLSSDAVPEEVTRLAEAAGLKVVPTGLDHGTVTVVSGGKGFEVTTFRRDVATFGRHAEVSYSTDMGEDARRRDFTMNALYATPQGVVVDPLGTGVTDCLARRIRFIEDAATRIEEDYLRILRYFRFHAWYADPEAGFDADALDAIASHIAGLETLSAERVGGEVMRLLAAPDPTRAVAAMRQTGCLACILPGSDDRFLGPVVHLEDRHGQAPDAVLRLAALGGDETADRLRLSRKDRRHLELLRDVIGRDVSLSEIAYRHGARVGRSAAILRAAAAGACIGSDELQIIETASAARFPMSAADLMPAYSGRALGEKLAALEDRWIASGFRLTREELTAED